MNYFSASYANLIVDYIFNDLFFGSVFVERQGLVPWAVPFNLSSLHLMIRRSHLHKTQCFLICVGIQFLGGFTTKNCLAMRTNRLFHPKQGQALRCQVKQSCHAKLQHPRTKAKEHVGVREKWKSWLQCTARNTSAKIADEAKMLCGRKSRSTWTVKALKWIPLQGRRMQGNVVTKLHTLIKSIRTLKTKVRLPGNEAKKSKHSRSLRI